MQLYKKKSTLFAMLLIAAILFNGCKDNGTDVNDENRNYRQDMRDFVEGISVYAKSLDNDFLIIPQNGHQLITDSGEASGELVLGYLNAIDGVGREDLFYGYNGDYEPTPLKDTQEMIGFMDVAEQNDVQVLVTDYCRDTSFVDSSYQRCFEKGYISFAAEHRDLNNIPDYPGDPFNENSDDIGSLADAKNFLYLINCALFSTKEGFLDALQNTNYDIILIDLFFKDGVQLSAENILSLKTKLNGGKRLIIAYMSIGEAEDYRYYWKEEWRSNPPSWMEEENPHWEGNYKVRYWDETWQDIIFGNDESYLKKIIDSGFDGVYLDIIDAFEYFEED